MMFLRFKRRFLSVYVIFVLVAAGFAGLLVFDDIFEVCMPTEGKTIIVDKAGNGDYTTITSAINNAVSGDTIRVWAGVYKEPVNIGKEVHIIGNGSSNTTIDANGNIIGLNFNIISIKSSVSGFKIFNSTGFGVYINGDYSKIENCVISPGASYGIFCTGVVEVIIRNNTISGDTRYGIYHISDDSGTFCNNTITTHKNTGMLLYGSKHTVENNTVYNNTGGIQLSGGNSRIAGNKIVNNSEYGINILSTINEVSDNYIHNNAIGVFLSGAKRIDLINNSISGSTNIGLYSYRSTVMVLKNNSFQNDGIFITGNVKAHFNTHNISTNNTVNGKPVYYYRNSTNISFSSQPVGQLILGNCTNVSISDLQISNTVVGIESGFSTNLSITNSTISNNSKMGIYLYNTNRNNLSGNDIHNNCEHGIEFLFTQDNRVVGNNFSSNVNATYLSRTLNTNVTNNTFQNDGVFIEGTALAHYNTHEISLDNTVNGKPLYYYKNQSGIEFHDQDAGQIIMANCSGLNFSHLELSNTNVGFATAYSHNTNLTFSDLTSNCLYGVYSYRASYSTFINNNITINRHGMYLSNTYNVSINNSRIMYNNGDGLYFTQTNRYYICNNNISYNNNGLFREGSAWNYIITGNNVTMNTNYGIWAGTDFRIFHNNFIDNGIQGGNGFLDWDNGYPSGGNYWSDYTGVDDGSGTGNYAIAGDGIGDTNVPHLSLDEYPFMRPSGWLYPGTPILKDPGVLVTGGNYTVQWNSSRSATRYELEEDTSPGFSAPTTIYDGTGLSKAFVYKNNGTYYYRVKAHNNIDVSLWSNVVDIVVDRPPTTPTGLSTTDITGTTVKLTWTQNPEPDIAGYHVFMNRSGGGAAGPFDHVQSVPGTSTQATVIGLVEETTYYFVIRAYDGVPSNSTYSNVASGTTIDATAPLSPTGLTAEAVSNRAINLSWNANSESDLEGYLIYMNDTNAGPFGNFHVIHTITGTSTAHSVTGLAEEVTYYFKVRAFDEAPNNSTFSDAASATTLDWTAPAAPAALAANAVNNHEVGLSWDANSEPDLAGYQIFMNDTGSGPTGSFSLIHTITGYSTSYLVEDLDEKVTYYFKLKAFDDVSNYSPFSVVVNATTPDMTPPAAPTGLIVLDPTPNSLTLRWNANSEPDLAGYVIYNSKSETGPFYLVNEDPVTGIEFIDTGLDEDTYYYYKLKAVDSSDLRSGFSNMGSGKTLMGNYPPEVRNPIPDISIPEDSYNDDKINLLNCFKDRNDDQLYFICEGQSNIEVTIFSANGTVALKPRPNWNGKETLTFSASDDTVRFIPENVTVTVTAVNDPPYDPKITGPLDLSEYNQSQEIHFTGECQDPDLAYGDELSYMWTSNKSGKLGEGKNLTVQTSSLSAGLHQIFLKVKDEKGAMIETSIVINIESGEDGPPTQPPVTTPDEDEGLSTMALAAIVALIVVVIIMIALFLVMRKRRSVPVYEVTGQEPGQPLPSPQPPGEPPQPLQPYQPYQVPPPEEPPAPVPGYAEYPQVPVPGPAEAPRLPPRYDEPSEPEPEPVEQVVDFMAPAGETEIESESKIKLESESKREEESTTEEERERVGEEESIPEPPARGPGAESIEPELPGPLRLAPCPTCGTQIKALTTPCPHCKTVLKWK